jgi:2,4-dienoyl-CoA reductase-like NADH-dependent reductase (Old Yellow Enzyme family)
MENDIIFKPLAFRNLTVKNRIFRSNITGRFDNYDGSGTQARINWEEKFARGGVGAILRRCLVHVRGGFTQYAPSITTTRSHSGAKSERRCTNTIVSTSCSSAIPAASAISQALKTSRSPGSPPPAVATIFTGSRVSR